MVIVDWWGGNIVLSTFAPRQIKVVNCEGQVGMYGLHVVLNIRVILP